MMLPSSPAAAFPLIEHLSMWGEVSAYEVSKFSAGAVWLGVLCDTCLIEEVHSREGATIAWTLTRQGEALIDAHPDGVTKLALFQVPAYRSYLIGILAEGVALAAKADMYEQLEEWTGAELAALLPEINSALDTIEGSTGRIVDVGRGEIEKRCSAFPGRNMDFSTWDQLLVGRAGRPQDLFDFVLRKFAPLATLPAASRGDGVVTMLRRLPLTTDDGFDLEQVLRPCAWNIRRRLRSGVSLFDEQGRYLHEPNLPGDMVLWRALQDALIEHPCYRAVVNLAVCAWRSPATTMPTVALRVPSGTVLYNVELVVDSCDAGLLRKILPGLVHLQGMRVRGLPDYSVPPELMDNLLNNLLEYKVLAHVEDELRLHPDFQRSLVAQPRLGTVYRPGKELQKRMLESLASECLGIRGDHP